MLIKINLYLIIKKNIKDYILKNYNLKMKNILLFFFIFTIVLNMKIEKTFNFTEEKIDEILKNIKIIEDSNFCDKVTLKQKLKNFGLEQNKINQLYLQLINVCNFSKNGDKELFIRVIYEFLKKENNPRKNNVNVRRRTMNFMKKTKIYLCKGIMNIIDYDPSECEEEEEEE